MLLERDARGDRDRAELLHSHAESVYRELGIAASESPLAARARRHSGTGSDALHTGG